MGFVVQKVVKNGSRITQDSSSRGEYPGFLLPRVVYCLVYPGPAYPAYVHPPLHQPGYTLHLHMYHLRTRS